MENNTPINQRRAELSSAKRALLEQRLRGARGGGTEADPPIPRRTGSDPVPLSFVQQRLWFLSQLEPQNPFYNIYGTALLIGTLDIGVLERSIVMLLERHESLRTFFPVVDGQASAVVLPASSFRLEQIELGPLPEDRYEAVLRAEVEALMLQPFNLAGGLLFRAILLRLDAQHHGILFLMHHIIADGWSIGIFNHEFALCYQALAQGRAPTLSALPIQYADYAVWQHNWLQGAVLERHLSHWRRQLADSQPLFPLPTDFPRPPVQTFVGAHYHFPLSPERVAALTALGRQEGATLFMTLLAAFQILLGRYSGQDDILVGTPSANRTRPELEGLIGMFVSTLALRVNLGDQPSFRELLRRVRNVTAAAYEHQDLPFEQLLEELKHPRSLSYSPIFQIFFALQNVPTPPVDLPRLRISRFETGNNSVKFDLTLNIEEMSGGGLMACFDYRTDLFLPATIERMAEHYQILLDAILADPEQTITRLPLLTVAERQQLLGAWNATGAPFAATTCIHQHFEAQAARTPQATALVAGSVDLSYAELNQRANQLAHYLRRHGVGPESYVAVCLHRSPEAIVSLLAVLKAGGAYIPLDPHAPAERLAFILADAQPRAVITDAAHSERFTSAAVGVSATPAPILIQVDVDSAPIAAEPATNPVAGVQPANLAYLIYTSGSAGQPKGVMIAHQALVHYAEAARAMYGLTAADRVLQFASLSFDTSVEEIYPTLTSGATLVLRDEAMLATAASFIRQAEAWELTVISLPTAYWHELTLQLPELRRSLPPTLRLVIIGGEEALAERVALWRQHVPEQVRLVNTYGPTETTVVATICGIDELPSEVPSVPIGRPIQNVQTYVLDQHMQPVPVGVPGELYIGGAGVARGYLNRPDLTAARFLPNPFIDSDTEACAAERLYRTGDRVRYRPDGALEFLGRSDFQVKIRGFRIEPGEIEQRLSEHPEVEAAAVVVYEPQPGDRRLAAYVATPRTDGGFPAELRMFLKTRVPDYMLPALLVPLTSLPLTSSGKLDRSALPAPEETGLAQQAAYVPPEDALQAQLVRIWESILNRESISITDNFFELGGNSLLSMRLMARIEERMGQSLPLRTLYAAPTIKEFTAYLHERGWPGVLRLVDDLPEIRSPLVKIQPNGPRRPFFFVAPLGGIVPANVLVGFMDLVPYFGLDQPFYGLQLPSVAQPLLKHLDSNHMSDSAELARHVLEFAPSRRIIEDGAAQCIAAMREVQPHGPYLLGGFCSGGIVALEIAQQLRQQGEEIGFLGLLDTSAALTAGLQADQSEAALLAFARQRIAPQIERIEAPDTGDIAWFIRKDLGWATMKKDLEVVYEELNRLDPQDYWSYCVNELKHAGTVTPDTTEQEIYRLFQMFQVNKIGSSYVLSTYPLHVSDHHISLFLSEQAELDGDPTQDWAALTSTPIDLRLVPGDHGTLFLEPHIQNLAQQLLDKFAMVDQPV
ncbi:MAG TPA: amino acid adenylation domain-containing protein [Herpetosiphonaceae bacterium]